MVGCEGAGVDCGAVESVIGVADWPVPSWIRVAVVQSPREQILAADLHVYNPGRSTRAFSIALITAVPHHICFAGQNRPDRIGR